MVRRRILFWFMLLSAFLTLLPVVLWGVTRFGRGEFYLSTSPRATSVMISSGRIGIAHGLPLVSTLSTPAAGVTSWARQPVAHVPWWGWSYFGIHPFPVPNDSAYFAVAGIEYRSGFAGGSYFLVPLLYFFVFFALVTLFFHRRWSRSRKYASGGCAKCGYDLRAHNAGEKCPECGMVVTDRPHTAGKS